MKKKLLLVFLTLLVGGLAFAAARRGLRNRTQERGPKYAPIENKLEWYAQQAKANGKNEADVPALQIEYLGSSPTTDLNKALSVCSVIIAQPIQEETLAIDDEIVTWYRFKTVETLVAQDFPACPGCDVPIPPKELASISKDEFTTAKIGGTIVVDGVRLTTPYPRFPQFELGSNYLLFISKYSNGAAELCAGPEGVFTIDSTGNIKPVNGYPHSIKRDIQTKLGNSLAELKAYATQVRKSK